MNRDEALKMIEDIVVEKTFEIKNKLSTVIGIPDSVLEVPRELSGYVNEQRLLEFLIVDQFVLKSNGSGSLSNISPQESAVFRPYPPSIFIDTKQLTEDSKESGINEFALLEILMHHELVHMLMMSRFVGDLDSDWIKSVDLRFIHESSALRACETAFIDEHKYASKDDTLVYLSYVAKVSQKSKDARHYLPYFEKFRKNNAESFWHALVAASPKKLNFLVE